VRDLLIITPSRRRPASVKRLTEAVEQTCTADTDLIFAFDDDDPELEASVAAAGNSIHAHGPRQSMCAWTNLIAHDYAGDFRAIASLGDDHVPRTKGWDTMLLDGLDRFGGTGIAYGNDELAPDLPTAAVVTSDIVKALGWMCLPGLSSYCPDNVWFDLGDGAGCLVHRMDVIIAHLHWTSGLAPGDETYAEAGGFRLEHPDWAVYQAWRNERMADDVAIVKGLLG
jgi:hypothetical protein